MKIKALIITILVAFVAGGGATAQTPGKGDVFVPISKYISQGDVQSLSAWFADNLEISIISSTHDTSKKPWLGTHQGEHATAAEHRIAKERDAKNHAWYRGGDCRSQTCASDSPFAATALAEDEHPVQKDIGKIAHDICDADDTGTALSGEVP